MAVPSPTQGFAPGCECTQIIRRAYNSGRYAEQRSAGDSALGLLNRYLLRKQRRASLVPKYEALLAATIPSQAGRSVWH